MPLLNQIHSGYGKAIPKAWIEYETATNTLCIYPKDVQRITGKSERYCRTLLQKIKEYFKKAEHQFVTVEEFCSYTGIKAEQVSNFLSN